VATVVAALVQRSFEIVFERIRTLLQPVHGGFHGADFHEGAIVRAGPRLLRGRNGNEGESGYDRDNIKLA